MLDSVPYLGWTVSLHTCNCTMAFHSRDGRSSYGGSGHRNSPRDNRSGGGGGRWNGGGGGGGGGYRGGGTLQAVPSLNTNLRRGNHGRTSHTRDEEREKESKRLEAEVSLDTTHVFLVIVLLAVCRLSLHSVPKRAMHPFFPKRKKTMKKKKLCGSFRRRIKRQHTPSQSPSQSRLSM